MVESKTPDESATLLLDPLKDRKVKAVPLPPAIPLSEKLAYSFNLDNKPKADVIRKHLNLEGTVTKALVIRLVTEVTRIFSKFKFPNHCVARGRK